MLSAKIKCCRHKIIIFIIIITTIRLRWPGGRPKALRGPLVRGEQAWRRPFLQLAGPLWRRQGCVDTAGKKVFLSLINHFCTGALREGHPRVTGLVLTGAPGGGRRGPGLNPGAKGRSEVQDGMEQGYQAPGTPRPGDFPARMFVHRAAAFLPGG